MSRLASIGLLSLLGACASTSGTDSGTDAGHRPWLDHDSGLGGDDGGSGVTGQTGDIVVAILSLRPGPYGTVDVWLVSPAEQVGSGVSSITRLNAVCDGGPGQATDLTYAYEPSGWWALDGEGVDVAFVGSSQDATVAMETRLLGFRCEEGEAGWANVGTITYRDGKSYVVSLVDEAG